MKLGYFIFIRRSRVSILIESLPKGSAEFECMHSQRNQWADNVINNRSSERRCSTKKAVLKNFAVIARNFSAGVSF